MIGKVSLAAGLMLAAATFTPMGASAATFQSPVPAAANFDGTLLHKAQWGWGWHGYGRCRSWRHECAARWGWRTRGFFRCLARHGC